MQAPGEVAIALFYHDAVCDTRTRDNEEQSTALAAEVLLEYCRMDRNTVERIRALILATRHEAVPSWADAELLFDIDLAILGADEMRFDEYERQIRVEYSWVAPEDFRKGRSAVLRGFLARNAIYATGPFRGGPESAARRNLARSLAALA